jgi:hypothetical protein
LIRVVQRPISAAIGASLLLTLAGALWAQPTSGPRGPRATAPDLSGTWVLDKDKSDFGLFPEPGADTATYTREDTVYRVVEAGGSDTGTTRVTYAWPVGTGQVSSNLPDEEASVSTRVTQHGDTALFVSQLRHEGKTMEIESGREYLSPDGKTRTREFDLQNLANPDEDEQHVTAVFRRE